MRSAFYGRVTARTTHGKEARNPRCAPSWPTRHTQRMHDRRPRRPGFSSTALDTVVKCHSCQASFFFFEECLVPRNGQIKAKIKRFRPDTLHSCYPQRVRELLPSEQPFPRAIQLCLRDYERLCPGLRWGSRPNLVAVARLCLDRRGPQVEAGVRVQPLVRETITQPD